MKDRFKRLLDRGLLTEEGLNEARAEADFAGEPVEEYLIRAKGIPKHEVLLSLAEFYNLPFIEYSEDVAISQKLLREMDMERLKKERWCPLKVEDGYAYVAACDPASPGSREELKKALGVPEVKFCVALPSDLARIIEHNQDINPRFPPAAGRTPLAKVRTFLANKRSQLACYRTHFARGRTGLAFLRTGLSFATIGLLLLRIFGLGWVAAVGGLLVVVGIGAVYDGLNWYLPTRKTGRKRLDCNPTESTWGTTVLEASGGPAPAFSRTAPVEGAGDLRYTWKDLSPVMRRRYLASDRTDMAEERTVLACYRTLMARARTGLAFTRTGFAFFGLGVTLLRQFKAGPWMALDISLVAIGVLMALEGFHWYFPGRKAGSLGKASVDSAWNMKNIWDLFFPSWHKAPSLEGLNFSCIPVKPGQSPGIWATTGLALERTVLADRRNVMARIRTVMARSRTGMALLRTGIVISSIGLGLLVYFGAGSAPWTVFDSLFIAAGLVLMIDGLYWHIPAERTRRQFPYCAGGLEIAVSNYGRPAREWGRAVFVHEDE